MNIWRLLNPSKFINLSRVGGQSGFLFETKESRSSSIEEKCFWKRQFACWFDSNHLRQSDDEVGPGQWNFHFEGTQLRVSILSWKYSVDSIELNNCLINEEFTSPIIAYWTSFRQIDKRDAWHRCSKWRLSLVRAQDCVKRLHWSVEHFRPLKCRACLLGSGCRFYIVVFKLRSDLKISQKAAKNLRRSKEMFVKDRNRIQLPKTPKRVLDNFR